MLQFKPGEVMISQKLVCVWKLLGEVVLHTAQRNVCMCTRLVTHYSHFLKHQSGSWHPGTAGGAEDWSSPQTCCWPTGLTGILCHSQSCLLTWPSSKTTKNHEVSSLLPKAPQQLHNFTHTPWLRSDHVCWAHSDSANLRSGMAGLCLIFLISRIWRTAEAVVQPQHKTSLC